MTTFEGVMTALIILLLILILLLSFVLFAPIQLRIDTLSHAYYVDMGRAIRASLRWRESPVVHLRILFFSFNLDPMRWGRPGRKKKAKRKPGKKKGFSPARIWAIIKTFKCKVFRIGLDTNDVYANAVLLPPAVILSRFTPAQIRINYSGENYAVIEIENRVARVLWAYMAH